MYYSCQVKILPVNKKLLNGGLLGDVQNFYSILSNLPLTYSDISDRASIANCDLLDAHEMK